jgi:hypothetical protein
VASIPVTTDDMQPGGSGQTLEERYGVEPAHRHRVRLMAVAAVALILIGWLGWAAWSHGRADVSGRVEGYDVVSPHETEVTVEIVRHQGQSVVCDAVAQADDHTTVGEDSVTIRAGDADRVTAHATIRTDRAATTVTLSGCRTAD